MTSLTLVSLILMSAVYCIAGAMHFIKPKGFISITPKWVPSPEKVNVLVGAIELILGIALLFNLMRSYAAIGIIVLLIAVFPANVNHFQKARRKGKGVAITLIRLPIQILLIFWAYSFV